MEFAVYQGKARLTAIYPADKEILYTTLGLCGEAGEVAETLKKHFRDTPDQTHELRAKMKAELGDVLWYVANLASDLGLTMEEIAQGNLDKLADRKNRGVLKGSGDNR